MQPRGSEDNRVLAPPSDVIERVTIRASQAYIN